MIWQSFNNSKNNMKLYSKIIFIIIFILYLILRGYAWKQNVFLEDHDGISYMNHAKMFLNLKYEKLKEVNPDSTSFYPLMTAFFSLPGWDVEIGARLCSMFFSGVLFLSLILIGRKIASGYEIAIGLLLLSCSPIFIPFSFAVLTEPTYVGMIYIGLAMYMSCYDNEKIRYAALLGMIFGFAFLNRLEGIIYIAIIPFFHAIYYWFRNDSRHDGKKFILWNVLYVLVFLTVISPQVYNVSSKMGRLALNGREAWNLILQNPDGKTYEEKLHGLTYSEKEIDLLYIQKHPEVRNNIYRNISGNFKKYVSNISKEYDLLYQTKIGILIGPFGLIFFTLGFVALYRRGYFIELFIISAFIGSSLIPPLMHSVWIRHIAIIGPIMILLEGIGIAYTSDVLSERIGIRYLKHVLTIVFLIVVVGSFTIPLRDIYVKNHNNELFKKYYEYPGSYQHAAAIIKNVSEKELEREPNVLSRKTYISYYAEGKFVNMPYTDYKRLVKYSKLNNVDFLYLEDYTVSSYPFLKVFREAKPHPDFLLLYETRDPNNRLIQLYRFIQPDNSFRKQGN